MLKVDRLGKKFGRRWIFREISFQLNPGDCLAVLGQNGSGKSTLLRVIASLLPQSEGGVSYEGDSRTALGYSALEQALYPNLTVAEHLEMASRLRGCEARTDELLSVVGLASARDQFAAYLSTGMKARLKMALAIQARPPILLLDEPGASLDEHGRALLEQIASEQTERGCLLFATNDPNERRLANLELELAG